MSPSERSGVADAARRQMIESGIAPELADELVQMAGEAGRAMGAPWWKRPFAWRAWQRKWRR